MNIEVIRAWVSTGALLGLLTFASRLWVQNRKLRMQEKVEDRQGFGALIEAMGKEISRLGTKLERAETRIQTLETERDREHALIVELLRQTNRTQAVAIMGRTDVSPELRRAMETTLNGVDTSI